MMINLPQNRYQASLLHLLGSCIISGLVVFLVFFFWYPGLLASATGVTKVFLIVIAVDICLGPLLTLVIFNKKKPELKTDLAIIFAIQVAALIYGIHTVASVRPTFLVFAVDRFEVVHANEIDPKTLEQAVYKEFQSLSYTGPLWATAVLPDDIDERNDLLFTSSVGGTDLAQTPKYYIPYKNTEAKVIEKSKPIEELFGKNNDRKDLISVLKKKYKHKIDQITYIPLTSKKRDLSVLLEKNSSEIIKIVDLDPW